MAHTLGSEPVSQRVPDQLERIEHAKIQRFLLDYKVELTVPGSQEPRTFTLAYITFSDGNPTYWTALGLELGDEVDIQIRYDEGGEIFCDLHSSKRVLSGSFAEQLLSRGLAVIRPDANSLRGFAEVAPRLRAYQALAQGRYKGFWEDRLSSPTSAVAIGTIIRSPSGRSMWRFDPDYCSIRKNVFAMLSASRFVIFQHDDLVNDNFRLLSIRIPPGIEIWAEDFLRCKLSSCSPLLTFEVFNGSSIFGKMTVGDTDVGSMLVEKGLAIPTCSKSDPALLTPYERSLLELQATAIRKKRGIHFYSQSLTRGLTNISETHLTAERAFSHLRDQTRIPAKLVNATSGGVLNFDIPTDRSLLTLVLARVWVPRVEEPFGTDALELITSFVSEERAEISVESTDAYGRFMGDVYSPSSQDSLSVTLVKQGFADIREVEGEGRRDPRDDYIGVEASAKAQKRFWQVFARSEARHEFSKLESAKKAAIDAQRGLWQAFPLLKRIKRTRRNDTATTENSLYLSRYIEVTTDMGLVLKCSGFAISRWNRRDHVPVQISMSRVLSSPTEVGMSFLKFPAPSGPDGWGFNDQVFYFLLGIREKKLVARVDDPSSCPKVTLFADKSNRPDDSINWLLVREGYADVESLETARGWAKFPQWEVVYDSLCEARNAARLDGVKMWSSSKEELYPVGNSSVPSKFDPELR